MGKDHQLVDRFRTRLPLLAAAFLVAVFIAMVARLGRTPEGEAAITEDDVFDFSSGYIQRGKHIMPRNSVAYPWRLNQEYVLDRKRMKEDPLADGILTFTKAGANARSSDQQLEAAE